MDNQEAVNDRRPGEELGGNQGGQAQCQQGDLPERDHPRSAGRTDAPSGRSRNAASVGDGRWEPSLVDDDWHAVCHGIYNRVEQAKWANPYLRGLVISKQTEFVRGDTSSWTFLLLLSLSLPPLPSSSPASLPPPHKLCRAMYRWTAAAAKPEGSVVFGKESKTRTRDSAKQAHASVEVKNKQHPPPDQITERCSSGAPSKHSTNESYSVGNIG